MRIKPLSYYCSHTYPLIFVSISSFVRYEIHASSLLLSIQILYRENQFSTYVLFWGVRGVVEKVTYILTVVDRKQECVNYRLSRVTRMRLPAI